MAQAVKTLQLILIGSYDILAIKKRMVGRKKRLM
jgi:hypothetical protein